MSVRKTFVQVLKEGKIDIRQEYDRLYTLFYERYIKEANYNSYTLYELINTNFILYPFRGTCLTLNEFNSEYRFKFKKDPEKFDEDYLISFCEYYVNMLKFAKIIMEHNNKIFPSLFIEQVDIVIEKIGYMPIEENGIISYIPKSPAAISVAEIISAPVSYKVLFYNHHTLKGDIEGKKAILNQLASLLEPQRSNLKNINSTLEDMIFYCFNNLNIRHANIDVKDKNKYKALVATMDYAELENWYDELYQMCLLAFLELDNRDRMTKFKDLKTKIEENK